MERKEQKAFQDDQSRGASTGKAGFAVKNETVVPTVAGTRMNVNGKTWISVWVEGDKFAWYNDSNGGQGKDFLPLNLDGEPYDPYGASPLHT